jgi:ureidoglycolate hydrolase
MRDLEIRSLPAQPITTGTFAPFGQLIEPAEDGVMFGDHDAQLILDRGTPRFYIMRLHHKGRRFGAITRHQQCTQCLGSLMGQEWLLAVAPPNGGDRPDLSQIQAFRIPGTCLIKLHVGTWHAGPYFDVKTVDFYNLELSDTNQVDHDTYSFLNHENLQFEIVN